MQMLHRQPGWRFSAYFVQPLPELHNLLKPYLRKATVSSQTLAMKSIEEADVGILCYISQLPGFRGVLKQRYSDFIVNEVDSDGSVVHLTSLDAPPEVDENKMETTDHSFKSYTSEIESFKSLAGQCNAELLKAFLDQIISGVEDVSPLVLCPDADKSHRTEMHKFFKEKFKFLVTDTVDGPDASTKCIRVRLNSGNNQKRGRNSRKRKDRSDKPFDSRGSDDWSEHVGKFLRFHLYKENKDTQEALQLIGKMLGIQQRSFGFAGTKDKRSVSTQRVTVFKQRASRLAALNERLIGIKVGDFGHVNEELLLGQLSGNRFTVTLRGVVADSEDIIKASVISLGKNGFINYFGLQRFGSGSVPTQIVGAALLRGEWKEAVNMILDAREGERDSIRQAREYYRESDDIEGTLRQLPRYLVAERAILQCLKKCPGNYLQALKGIPRTLRMMYVHSYQSYLWNHAASVRVQKYGTTQVVLGDLVYCKGKDIERSSEALSSSGYEDGSCNEIDHCSIQEEILSEERDSVSVKAVNAEDLAAGTYTIDDVVLPLPGSRVIYPANDVAEVYHNLASKDNVNLIESVHNVKEFSITCMSGGYRRVFQKPLDFEWEMIRYTDGNIPLAETDLDIIAKSKHEVTKEPILTNQDKNETLLTEREGKNDEGGIKAQLALKLSFTLPASCYATMAIRELLKTSTSVAFHKTLNA